MPDMFSNPILPGFYPDPSICRFGEDFYLVTSSFEYFPGIPIFHSKDLVNWRQIGHVLDRPSQLNLDGAGFSRGIFAPTIRHHKGMFYVITTLIDQGGNFFVTAPKPEGPWSDPTWLNAPEIDPSLFFDDDGRVWYTGNGVPKGGPQYEGHREIWLQEIDLTQGKMVGPIYSLWDGAVKGAVWAEAPHIYKINDWYYLLISEGGTGHEHAVSVARSRSIVGPYQGYNRNPILTHRHLGLRHPIVNAGHGDLVDTIKGEWWIVLLASRPYGGYYRNLGRETFLAPVIWEEDWPVISPGSGRIEDSYRRPALIEHKWHSIPNRDDFEDSVLGFGWICLRTPREAFWSLSERGGFLRLKARPQSIINKENPSFLAQRQRHKSFRVACLLDPKGMLKGSNAGLVAYQSGDYQLRFSCFKEEGQNTIKVISREAGIDTELACLGVKDEEIALKIEAKEQEFSFSFSIAKNDWYLVASGVDGRLLSSDRAGGFVGTVIGVYASTEGKAAGGWADFDWFEYSGSS